MPDQFELGFKDYQSYWNPAEKKGYSGTGILSRIPLLHVETGMSVMVTGLKN